LIDESHPAARLRNTALFPRFSNANITIRAFPKAVLQKPDVMWPDPPYTSRRVVGWDEQLQRLRQEEERGDWDAYANPKQTKAKFVDMSMPCMSWKATSLKTPAIRGRVVRRLKTAVSLIITLGADVRTTSRGGPQLVFD